MNIIKEIRLHKGLTQEEFCDRAGMGQSYLSKIERDGIVPRIDLLYSFRDARLITKRDLDHIIEYYGRFKGAA